MRSSSGIRLLPTSSESALIAVFFLASSGTMQQYLGVAGALAYLVALLFAIPLAIRWALPRFLARTSERRALWLGLLTLAALVVLFAVVYPHANSHGGLTGSDRDDAANLATRHLLHLRYPYSTPTYLGNYVSQLPGALFLDAPFVILGNSAYQNLFWLPVLFLGLRYYYADARLALFVVWCTLLSPAVMREFLTGGDLIANSVYVLVFALGVLRFDPATRGGRWWKAASALGLGLALSSRANFVFIVPLVFACLVRRQSWRAAVTYSGIAVTVAVIVTLPFYLDDRSGFSPLLTEGKFSRLNGVLPHSSAVVLAVAGLLALFLAWRKTTRLDVSVFRNDVIVQGFLIVAVVVLSSIHVARLDFSFLVLGYGLFIVFAAAFGIWGGAFPKAP